jgi:hypothetical protein
MTSDENEDSEFEILPAGVMREKYSRYAEFAPEIVIDPKHVPRSLWPLIPYAKVWGITDDLMRADLANKLGKDEVAKLHMLIQPFEDALDDWLAGPEASSPSPTAEYLAFTCMRMAADGV